MENAKYVGIEDIKKIRYINLDMFCCIIINGIKTIYITEHIFENHMKYTHTSKYTISVLRGVYLIKH